MILQYETFVKWFESCADENAITGYISSHILLLHENTSELTIKAQWSVNDKPKIFKTSKSECI